jgi:ferredoxin-NADP reductase
MTKDSANGIDGSCYRISVKALVSQTPATDTTPASVYHGLASTFINQSVCAGDRIEVKAPAGQFWLDEDSPMPVVLLAGGIGITPMLSMLERMQATGSQRSAVLFYGVNNSREHAFDRHLQSIAAAMPNVHVINCYSRPLPSDVPKEQFQVQGFVSIDLLKQVLPNNHYQFYMCGPPPFMESLYQGLVDWQVPEGRIHYEAFGPASIGTKKTDEKSAVAPSNDQVDPVIFVRSGKTALWSAEETSLLELAEANGIFPDSGCRAGSCGSCETGLLSGKVNYAQGQKPDCGSNKCLLCIASPDGPVELDL